MGEDGRQPDCVLVSSARQSRSGAACGALFRRGGPGRALRLKLVRGNSSANLDANSYKANFFRNVCYTLTLAFGAHTPCTHFVSTVSCMVVYVPHSHARSHPHRYAGNPGDLGWNTPQFERDAPALLGFDESIDRACHQYAPRWKKNANHAERCVSASLNILSLYGDQIPCALREIV